MWSPTGDEGCIWACLRYCLRDEWLNIISQITNNGETLTDMESVGRILHRLLINYAFHENGVVEGHWFTKGYRLTLIITTTNNTTRHCSVGRHISETQTQYDMTHLTIGNESIKTDFVLIKTMVGNGQLFQDILSLWKKKKNGITPIAECKKIIDSSLIFLPNNIINKTIRCDLEMYCDTKHQYIKVSGWNVFWNNWPNNKMVLMGTQQGWIIGSAWRIGDDCSFVIIPCNHGCFVHNKPVTYTGDFINVGPQLANLNVAINRKKPQTALCLNEKTKNYLAKS